MKNKTISILFLGVIGVVASAIALSHSHDVALASGTDEHSSSCTWNHYLRVEPTYENDGIQEYYVCCSHHESVLERPTLGTIVDKGTPSSSFISGLEDNDFRLIPSYRKQVKPVQDEIDGLSEAFKISDGSQIDKAYNLYNNTSEELKTYVNDVSKLEGIYERYHESYDVLIDTVNNEYQSKIYNSNYDVEPVLNENAGYCSSFTNITPTDDNWIGFGTSKTTNISNYSEILLYVYNNLNFDCDFDVRYSGSTFDLTNKVKVYSKSWSEITIPLSTFITNQLKDLFVGTWISDARYNTFENGFLFSSLYGVKKITTPSRTYIDLSDDQKTTDTVNFVGDKYIEDVNYAAFVYSPAYSASLGKVNFITTQPYSNVTSVSFDAKIDGTATGWWGIGHSTSIENARIYNGMCTTGVKNTQNEFQHITINVSVTDPEYIYFIFEVGTFTKNVYIDNVTIVSGGVEYTDDFDSGSSALFNNSSSVLGNAVSIELISSDAKFLSRSVKDYYVEVSPYNYDTSTLYTRSSYTGVYKVAYDAKVDGTIVNNLSNNEQIWWGFGVTDDPTNVYSGLQFVREVLSTDNEWKHFEYEIQTPVDGYVHFVFNPLKTNVPVLLDNITFFTDSSVFVENFTDGLSALFNVGAHLDIKKKSDPSITFNGGINVSEKDYSVLMDIYNYGNVSGNEATFKTKIPYNNVTSISYDMKIDGTITFTNTDPYWVGVGHDANQNASIYKGLRTSNTFTTNDGWMRFTYTFSGLGSEYFFFVSNPVHAHNNVYFDNVIIVSDGVEYTDTFTNGKSELLNLGSYVSLHFESESMTDEIAYNVLTESQCYFEGPQFVRDNLENYEALVYGSIAHQIIGQGRYAILIYNDLNTAEYLFVDDEYISYCSNASIINTTPYNGQSYNISVSVDGRIAINNQILAISSGVNDSLKFVSFFSQGSVVFTDISLDSTYREIHTSETIDGIEVPYLYSEDNIVFNAYGSPTVADWNGVKDSNPTMATDEIFQDYYDAGFRKCLPLFEGRTGARYDFNTYYDLYLEATGSQKESYKNQCIQKLDIICEKADRDAMEIMSVASKYGIKYVVLNSIIFELIGQTTPNGNNIQVEDYPWIFDRVFRDDSEYFYQVQYVGNFMQDEPIGVEGLERLYAAVVLYYQYTAALGIESEPVINLLPGSYTDNNYVAYLDYYFEHIAPLVGYVSFDQYVLQVSNGTYSVKSTHLSNLYLLASRAKQYNVDLRTFIFPRCQDEGSNRGITMSDELRFQIYANLAFGAKEIIYYGYTTHNSTNETEGLVNMYTGEKSDVYYYAKEVNNEVLSFGQAYMHFSWDGIIGKDTGGWLSKNTCLTQLSKLNSMNSHAGLSSFSVNKNSLIGCFKDSDSQYAYILMYYGDPKTASGTDTIQLTFLDKYNGVIVYQNGGKHAYRIDNHKQSITLNPGCGAFVIPVTLN